MEFTPDTEGVWFNLPESVYRSAPGISQTTLKQFSAAASPLHFRTAPPKEPTPDMEFGTIMHCAILEPSRLKDAYHLRPDTYADGKKWHGGATECKKWLADHSDRPVLTAEDEAKIPKIVAGLSRLEEFSEALANGQREVSFFKRDAETGLLLKARCDLVATDSDGFCWVWDLKKVQAGCASRSEFEKSCMDYGYFVQSASYRAITGASRFIFVPFDGDEPFDATQFEPDSDSIAYGWREYRRMLTAYAACVTTDTWPGYSHEIQPLSLPGWVKRKELYG